MQNRKNTLKITSRRTALIKKRQSGKTLDGADRRRDTGTEGSAVQFRPFPKICRSAVGEFSDGSAPSPAKINHTRPEAAISGQKEEEAYEFKNNHSRASSTV